MTNRFSERPSQIAIKCARAVVPGFGSEGQRFGTLVPSREILGGIRPRRRPRISPSESRRSSIPVELPDSWLQKLLGIESIATTHVTQTAVAEAVSSGLEWS